MSLFFAQNVPGVSKGNGYLYNFHAVTDANFAPADWRTPNKADIDALVATLGGTYTPFNFGSVGGVLKEVGLTHWNNPNTGATDFYGFNFRGGGTRTEAGIFLQRKDLGSFWMAETYNSPLAGYSSNITCTYDSNILTLGNYSLHAWGFSSRLVYIGAGTPTSVTDNDGNIIPVVAVGSQYWTAENWKCTTLDNGDPIPNTMSDAAWTALTTLGRCAYGNKPDNV